MARLQSVVVLLLGLTLVACKTELYAELPEEQANEMMALLMTNGIDAEKGPATKGVAPLSVPTSDISRAMEILRGNGYPQDSFDNLGTVFEQKGLVSSPLEERVRFIYGLSQTLSETLSQIEGVSSARVHIVLPEDNTLTEKSGKSTASVFLKTRSGVDLTNKVPEIKQLVQASVQGLVYDNVVVTLFESSAGAAALSASVSAPVTEDTQLTLASIIQEPIVLIVVGLILLVGVGGAVFVWRRGGGETHGSLIVSSSGASKAPVDKGAVQPEE
ncbi:MAG: type III secretion inner membrane ring lipoprotein SctJ [Pseudomonadota bacterium]